ncbi:MAG TPA: aminotransferase class V-fold PLP-dependent enzyme [Candidatus Dormibacteraeota bacterium]|nr:aminotransferase class V-fold PLP-dependent enzyme [Candidatus Dormibacteraeota bacterium]
MDSISRRKLLRKGSQAIVGGACIGVLPMNANLQTASAPAASPVDYYQKLGVIPFINAAGTYTILSASILPDEVQAAIAVAAQKPVHLMELHKAAGEYLAKRLRCEGALVTAGAAAAIKLATAASITRGNKSAIANIPGEMQGLKNEVIVQKAHHYDYDHAIRDCGARFVDVETLDEYERAFSERTVMTQFFNAAEGGRIGREDWVRVAHKHGVPCFNDAAADVPPISNLWNYTEMGFDLVAFSGGKGIRGPQCSGLLLGKRDLIDAAMLNNSPYSNTVGRGMKVGKEEIIGLVAAVDWFLKQDDARMEAEFRKRAGVIAERVQAVPSVQARVFIPPVANHVPHLLITYDASRVKLSATEVMQKMREGTPRIELNPSTGGGPASAGLPGGNNVIVVGVWMLQPGEDAMVGRRLQEVLAEAARS